MKLDSLTFVEYNTLNQIKDLESDSTSGDNGVEETLLSIPNRKVKLYSANGTAWVTVWESKTLPGNLKKDSLIAILFCVI